MRNIFFSFLLVRNEDLPQGRIIWTCLFNEWVYFIGVIVMRLILRYQTSWFFFFFLVTVPHIMWYYYYYYYFLSFWYYLAIDADRSPRVVPYGLLWFITPKWSRWSRDSKFKSCDRCPSKIYLLAKCCWIPLTVGRVEEAMTIRLLPSLATGLISMVTPMRGIVFGREVTPMRGMMCLVVRTILFTRLLRGYFIDIWWVLLSLILY